MILVPDMHARKPIKGSEDSDDSLVSKKILIQKLGLLDWRLRPGKLGQKQPTYDAPPRVPQTQN